ncbi:MAG TPA: OmpA family protein, partial [Geminicoccaceae bacterium]|nr:OmpA family protein [Geminicoccaceae bacterium]
MWRLGAGLGFVLAVVLAGAAPALAQPVAEEGARSAEAAAAGVMTAEEILGQLRRTRSIGGTARVDLPRVTFELNSARLTPEAQWQLDELARALVNPAFEGLPFTIAGHTDATGAEDYNLRLSEQRAASVARYLDERHGFAPDRMREEGYGKTRLLPDLPPTAPQQRRVEIR